MERKEELLLMARNKELLLSRRQVSLAQVSRTAQVMLRASSHLPQVPSQSELEEKLAADAASFFPEFEKRLR